MEGARDEVADKDQSLNKTCVGAESILGLLRRSKSTKRLVQQRGRGINAASLAAGSHLPAPMNNAGGTLAADTTVGFGFSAVPRLTQIL